MKTLNARKENNNKPLPVDNDKRTFRLSMIFAITVMGLMVLRAIFANVVMSDNVSSWVFSFAMQVGMMGIVPIGLYMLLIRGNKQELIHDFKLNVKLAPNVYVMAFVIGICMYMVNSGVSVFWASFLTTIGYQYPNPVGVLYRTPEILVMEILTTCILPAVFEEITDRGLFLKIFRDKTDRFKIVVVGLSFGVLHQNVPQLLPAAIAGLVLTFVAVKSGSIVPAMIIHFMNNFLVTITNYADQKSDGFSKFVSSLQNLMYDSTINFLIAVVGATFLLVFLTRQFAVQASSRREEIDGPGAGVATIRITPAPSQARDLLEVYGPEVLTEEEKKQITLEIVEAVQKAKEMRLQAVLKNGGVKAVKLQTEYLPVIIALVGAGIFTILTFIFRFRP
jgi:hypothetical protein